MLHELADQLAQELEYELEDEHEVGLEFEGEPEWAHFLEREEASAHEQEWEQARSCPGPRRETVSGFPRHQNSVRSLLPAEQHKIRNIAQLIRRSFQPGCPPIRTVRLMGHADRDMQRGPAFEKRISFDRARAVVQALKGLIGSPAISSRIAWQPGGVGASSLIVPSPRTEPERARNRRVEILLSRGAPNRWDRAVEENRRLAKSLAWQAYKSSIIHLLGFKSIPGDYPFAAAVARWQEAQRNLLVDGIIGPKTLKRMNTALRSARPSPVGAASREASFHEVAPDPDEMRRVYFEFRHEIPDGGEKFWTEGKYLGLIDVTHGHGELTDRAASSAGIVGADLVALKRGVARPDQSPSSIMEQLDECQQHRHGLRAALCQKMPAAIERIRSYLANLYECVLSMPTPQVPDRNAQFELIGEALHLIQDSYSPAHMERNWGGPGGVHPILYIRFWHPTSPGGPTEHRFPVDERDNLTVASFPINWVNEAVTASREFLGIVSRHVGRAGTSGTGYNRGELDAFMNKHLLLSRSHTTFTDVIRGLRVILDPGAAAYMVCLVSNPSLKDCENLLPRFCGPVREAEG
jgi:outer membrane protein OmpA-like peptidoglycan-associated protein